MDSSARRLYVFGHYSLDVAGARLLRDGEPVALRPKAFDALAYLVHRRGRLVGKDELIGALWPKVVVTDDSLVKCIQEARSALGEDGRTYIRTVPRRGYVFEGPVREHVDEDGAGPVRQHVDGAPAGPVRLPATVDKAPEPVGATPRQGGDPPSERPARPSPESAAFRASPAHGRLALLALIIVILAAATIVIAQRLEERGARESVASSAGAAAMPVTKSVAVLPFVSISADPDQDYFSDGISEELLNALANIPGLHVPSRTSSFAFKGAAADLETIAEALGVDHVLEGSVRKAGDQVRVTAQLIDAATDSHLWSATYDRELTNIFAIQDEIARSVAAALEVRLLGNGLPVRQGARTDVVEAHDAYLLGLHYLATQRSADIFRSRESFLRAIRLDPGYAAAHAAHAMATMSAQGYGLLDRTEALEEAARAVEQALALAPDLAEARSASASLSEQRGDYATAEAEYRRAIELNPAFSLAHFGLFSTLGRAGRVQEARSALERALELDPLNGFLNWWMGNAQLSLGNAESAAMYYRRGIEFESTQANSYAGLGDAAIVTGRLDEGLRWYLDGLAQDPGQAYMTTVVGLLYLSLGDLDAGREWLDRAAPMYGDEALSRLLREFETLVLRNENPAALLDVLRDLPRSALVALGTRLFRKAALRTGDLDGIEAFFRTHWPRLYAPDPHVDATNYDVAPDVAWIAAARGEHARARTLLERALAIVRDPAERPTEPIDWGSVLAEAEALALLGDELQALDALRRAVDAGWRFDWWQVEHDPTLASLRATDEFTALLSEVRGDLAAQLERVRELERTDALDGPPAD